MFTKQALLGNKSVVGTVFKEMRISALPELNGVDESIHSFVSRRFGVQVIVFYFICIVSRESTTSNHQIILT